MSFTKLQKQRDEIRSKLAEAKAELAELESEQEGLMESLKEVEEKRIEAKALVKVGKGSDKEADAIQAEYSKLKDRLDTVRDDINVQERATSMLEQERSEIESEFQNEARKKWRDIADEHLDAIADLMQQVQDEISTLNGYRNEMQKEGIQYPERSFFKGIGHHSQPLISTKRLGPESQQYIQIRNLKSD